jgi:hypothetical protein
VRARAIRLIGAVVALAAGGADAVAAETAAERAWSGALTGYYYAVPDQPNWGMAVGVLNHGALHLEARYNYEARASASAFVGWTFAGGDQVTWELTPIIGSLFGRARGVVPGVEASVGYKSLDVYVEAEYVFDRNQSSDNYFYAWSELGWKPVEWLRVGIVGQRTRVVNNDRDLQRGVLLQVFAGKATVSAFAFNPDNADRYVTLALGVDF